MDTKFLNTLLAFFFFSFLLAQDQDSFGKLTTEEENFNQFEKDSLANAVVLYEKGDYYFEVIDRRVQLVKKYHVKIKVLTEKGFTEGNISIPFYHTESRSEKIEEIKAITHNGKAKTGLSTDEIYTIDNSERWSEKRFTFPNLKKGSVLEYRYTLVSPFVFNLNGWSFQSNIPKLYSEFNAKIPGNYVYNRTLIGPLKLLINDASVKKNCFRIEGIVKDADCEVLKYVMKDIPAFKEDEEYMLAPSNYISRLQFELSELYHTDGTRDKFTKSWKDVDGEFKGDKDIGRQLTKKGFFEKSVPEKLLTEGDELTRAKNMYAFVQNHYTWNGKYGIYRDIRVKEAFNEKKGNIGEINIALINLLNSAGIKTHLMLLSTRENGLPQKKHPVMSDFNYVVAKAEIDGKDYLLDASDKINPFGMLPYRCLNYYGRVMDFKNDSYWHTIDPEEKNKRLILAQLSFDLDENKAHGVFNELNMGYDAVSKRRTIMENSKETYLENIEKSCKGDFNITSYKLMEERSDEKKVSEQFEFEVENLSESEIIYFDPFLVKFFERNPFILDERNYPIDFGFKRNYVYQANITVPDGYEVYELPEKKVIALYGNMGLLKFYHMLSDNKIALFFDLSLNSTHYEPDTYPALKDLFKDVTNIQNNSLVVLKKQ